MAAEPKYLCEPKAVFYKGRWTPVSRHQKHSNLIILARKFFFANVTATNLASHAN